MCCVAKVMTPPLSGEIFCTVPKRKSRPGGFACHSRKPELVWEPFICLQSPSQEPSYFRIYRPCSAQRHARKEKEKMTHFHPLKRGSMQEKMLLGSHVQSVSWMPMPCRLAGKGPMLQPVTEG